MMKKLEQSVKVGLSMLIKPAGQEFSSPTSSLMINFQIWIHLSRIGAIVKLVIAGCA
jgi:hypothetical protein